MSSKGSLSDFVTELEGRGATSQSTQSPASTPKSELAPTPKSEPKAKPAEKKLSLDQASFNEFLTSIGDKLHVDDKDELAAGEDSIWKDDGTTEASAGSSGSSGGFPTFQAAMAHALGGAVEPDKLLDAQMPDDPSVAKVAVQSGAFVYFMHFTKFDGAVPIAFKLHARNMNTYQVYVGEGKVCEFGTCTDFANAAHQPAILEYDEEEFAQLVQQGKVSPALSNKMPFGYNPYQLAAIESPGLELNYLQPGMHDEVNEKTVPAESPKEKGEIAIAKAKVESPKAKVEAPKAKVELSKPPIDSAAPAAPAEPAEPVDEKIKLQPLCSLARRKLTLVGVDIGSKEWLESTSILQHEQLMQLGRSHGYCWNTLQDVVVTVASHQEKFERFGASFR